MSARRLVGSLELAWRDAGYGALRPSRRKRRAVWLLVLTAVALLGSCTPATPAPTLPATATPTQLPTATTTPPLQPTEADTPEPSATPVPTASPISAPTLEPSPAQPVLSLEPADPVVRAYPGPTHYEGDLLTLEIALGEHVEPGEGPVFLRVVGEGPYQATGAWQGNQLRVQFDSTGLTGRQVLHIEAERGGVQVDETYRFELQPADQRPAQERNPAWVTREVDCCVLHTITDTAAARDIDWIAETVQQAADAFDQYPTVEIDETIDIYFIDRMWYNGAFGGAGELLAVYTDRYYGPSRGAEGLQVLVRHELGHAVFPLFSYSEGLSVYLAGGHYKPEPIPKRAAALLDLNYYYAGQGPVLQHEVIYLHQAAQIHYIVETYGWERLRDLIRADSEVPNPAPGQRDEIFEEALGVSPDAFEEAFVEWLRAHDPGDQVRDLELTIELQEVRRDYQDRYAPEPQFLLGYSEESFARPEYLLTNIREPRSPAHVATELLIANAQQALTEGRYEATEALIDAIEAVVTSGRLEHPLARDYGGVALALSKEGYEAVSLDLRGDEAVVEATASPPKLETLSLRRVDGRWQLSDSAAEPGEQPDTEPAAPTVSPVPATTTSPAPTAAAPTATATVLPANTLYFDDFSDPESGWDRHEEMKVSFGYVDDAYRIWIDFPGATYWFEAGESFSDAVVESRVTLLDGPDINRYGLMCRHDEGSMVQFLIDGRGRYGIVWQEEGLPTYLGSEGMRQSDAVNPAGEPNLLRAVCDGDTLSFFANGEELITAQDRVSSGSGDVGLVVSTVGGEGLEAVYDYVLVTEP